MTGAPVARTRLAELGLFRGLRRPVLERIAACCTEIEVPEGRQLCAAGEIAHEFVVVVDGAAAYTLDGGPTHRIGAGSCFGELGLVDGLGSPVTLVAVSPMRLIVCPGPDFRELLESEPAFASRILAVVSGRLRILMAELSERAEPEPRSPSPGSGPARSANGDCDAEGAAPRSS
jgi:CRP-like cAMP-binding protein